MPPTPGPTNGTTRVLRSPRLLRVSIALLTAVVTLMGAHLASGGGLGGTEQIQAASPDGGDATPAAAAADHPASTTSTSTTSTTAPTTTRPTEPESPPAAERYEVLSSEAEPDAKQLAVDIAYSLTNYEASDDHTETFNDLGGRYDVDALAEAAAPLIRDGYWSRGEVVYPQLGGLRNGRASVMVVTRQTTGSGSETESSIVRTLDIRLVQGESGWEFDYLSSAGGSFDRPEDLETAHAVASDPRIQMPDSARLDILSGLASPTLLELMAELAERTPYEVVTFATGHPHNVFETDRQSAHTIGQAVDINRIGDRLVVDDRGPDSTTRDIVEWLYDHDDVRQVGSPWDLDGSGSTRSFTDAVHQDHIHLAVNSD